MFQPGRQNFIGVKLTTDVTEDSLMLWFLPMFLLVDGFPQKTTTPPKFNIAPEKWWLEDYFPIGFR